MPFQYVLANLLSDIPTALAVAFLDEEGETVSLITSQESPEEVKVFGAYQGIHMNQLMRILDDEIDFFYYKTNKYSSYTLTVGDEYYMIVVTTEYQPLAWVRHIMKKAKREIEVHAL